MRVEEKAVSEVIGGILILFVMMLTISVLFIYGTPLLDETQTDIRMRNMVTQMVSLHEQVIRVSSDVVPSTSFKIATSDGMIRIAENNFKIFVNNSTSTLYSINESLNKLEYEYGNRYMAVENGGVWRRDSDFNQSIMVEAPRIQIANGSIAISLIRVQGTGASGGGGFSNIMLKLNSSRTTIFNEEGYITIEPDSRYSYSWLKYLEDNGAVITGNTANITFNRLVLSEKVVDVLIWG